MATSLFFEIPDDSRKAFARAESLSEWYEVVQAAARDDAPKFDGQDSAAAWQYSLQASGLQTAVGQLFVGEFRSGLEASADPAVVFLGTLFVSAIAADLRERGEAFFRKLLAEQSHEADVWMYQPLLRFMEEAANRKSAVVVLWGT
jgi:hypothetical protein